MPGLYGIYSRAADQEYCSCLLNDVGQQLSLFPSYKSQSTVFGNAGLGRVDINTKFSRPLYHDRVNKLAVSLWGAVFQVGELLQRKSETKQMKTLLMIAYVYPPIAYGGTYRSLRLSKYLSLMDYDVTVLTITKQDDLQNDDDLLDSVPANVAIERTVTIDPWRSYQKIKDRLQSFLLGRVLEKFISFALFIINMPDHMLFWVPFAVLRGRKLIRQKDIKVIYTSTPPHSGQLIGYFLKRITGVQWVADLRDPILGNLGGANWGWYEKKIHAKLEQLVCRNADHLIANTEYAANKLASRCPGCSVTVVRNGFDPDDFHVSNRKKTRTFTLAHLGSLYSFRKIDTILDALEQVVEQEKLSPKDICLRLVGLRDQRIVDQVAQSAISQYISIEEMVPHDQAIQIMVDSHLLLLIKGYGPDSAAQIPGKLYEYLGSGNRVIYIGPSNAEAADVIKECGAGYIVEDDAGELIKILMREFKAWGDGRDGSPSLTYRDLDQFSAKGMAEKIDRIMQELL